MDRCLAPELLDELPAHDPRAQRSRRDLRRINAWMGNARLAATCLAPVARRTPPRRIVDLGAGDGTFLLRLTQLMPDLASGTELVLVDQGNAVDERVLTGLRDRGFHPRVEQADAWAWLRELPTKSGTWVLANLFLHHFTASHLRAALATLSERTDLCCACEPRRAAWPLMASRLLWFIGANAVTRHDAVVSVRAGFAGQELSALWPGNTDWHLREHRTGLFSHLFLAQRASGATHVSP